MICGSCSYLSCFHFGNIWVLLLDRCLLFARSEVVACLEVIYSIVWIILRVLAQLLLGNYRLYINSAPAADLMMTPIRMVVL